MSSRDKAFKIAVTAVSILAFCMFAYYWIAWRTRKTENDINFSEKSEVAKTNDEKAEFSGVYSSTESIEGLNHRLGFFSVNRKDDGSGFFATAKVDAIASAEEPTAYLKCNDVNIVEKDFFIKCADPALGQISFVGEWQKGPGGIQVAGKILWIKDGTEVLNKATTLNHTPGN